MKQLTERKVPFSTIGFLSEADHYEPLESGLLVRTYCAVSSWCNLHFVSDSSLPGASGMGTPKLEQGVEIDLRVTVYHYGEVVGKHIFKKKKLQPAEIRWSTGEMVLLRQMFGGTQFSFIIAGSGAKPRQTAHIDPIYRRMPRKNLPKPVALILPKFLVVGIK